jgi:hypothetical protein
MGFALWYYLRATQFAAIVERPGEVIKEFLKTMSKAEEDFMVQKVVFSAILKVVKQPTITVKLQVKPRDFSETLITFVKLLTNLELLDLEKTFVKPTGDWFTIWTVGGGSIELALVIT